MDITSSSTFVPSFPTSYIDPRLEVLAINEEQKRINKQLEDILEYFADAKDPLEIKETALKPLSSSWSFCLGATAHKIVEMFKDTFLFCFPSCTDPVLKHRAWTTQEVYQPVAQARRYWNRNRCCLVGACGVTIATPLLPVQATVALALTILANLMILNCAGTLTYCCSGGFGTNDIKAHKNILEPGFELLAEYLKVKWIKRAAQDSKTIKSQCEAILNNWNSIRAGMLNLDFPEQDVEHILAPFAQVLREIKNSSN